MKISYAVVGFASLLAVATAGSSVQAGDRSPSDLSDLEIAHVAYTADNIDIRYAHLALAISENAEVQRFAKTMIRDHSAVNEQALALLEKLGAQPQDNFLSQSLQTNATAIVDELSDLRGAAFDRRYAENELAYHQAVNNLVATAFIPNIDHAEVKALFEAGLKIFKAHEHHAEMMVRALGE